MITAKNLKKAFHWYQKAAEGGHIEAQYNLDCLYDKGEGTAKNLKKAFHWYQKAVEGRHIEAQNNLKEAAEGGYIEAQYNLGYLYEKGEGVEKNLVKAFY